MFLNHNKGPDVAATDIRLRLSPLVYSVNTRRRISEYHEDGDDDRDKQIIYDEPHRPVATFKHSNILLKSVQCKQYYRGECGYFHKI